MRYTSYFRHSRVGGNLGQIFRVPACAGTTSFFWAAAFAFCAANVASARFIGEMSGVTKRTVPFDTAENADFTYTFDVLADLATTRLAIGVYDDTSRDSGFTSVDLHETKH